MEKVEAESDSGGEMLLRDDALEGKVDERSREVVGDHIKGNSEVEEVFEEAIDTNLEEVEADSAPEANHMAVDGEISGVDEVNDDLKEATLSERSVEDGSGSEEFQEASEEGAEVLQEEISPAPSDGGMEGVDERAEAVKGSDRGIATQTALGEVNNSSAELDDGLADEELSELTVEEQKEETCDMPRSFENGNSSEVNPVLPDDVMTVPISVSSSDLLTDNEASFQRSHTGNFPSPESDSNELVKSNAVDENAVDSVLSSDNSNAVNDCKHPQAVEGTDVRSSEDELASQTTRQSWIQANGTHKPVSDTEGMHPTAPEVNFRSALIENNGNGHFLESESGANDLQFRNHSDNEAALSREMLEIPPGLVKEPVDADVFTEQQQKELGFPQPDELTSSSDVDDKSIIVQELPLEKEHVELEGSLHEGSVAVNNAPDTGSLLADQYEKPTSRDVDYATSSVASSPADKHQSSTPLLDNSPSSHPAGLGSSAPLSSPADKHQSSTPLSDNSPSSHPAGLGSSAPLLGSAPRVPLQQRVNGTLQERQSQPVEEPANSEADEYDETREKLQTIRVKFLRLAHRLGQTPHNTVVAQVLYRLGLAEQLRGSRLTNRAGAFSFDRASAMAEQLEASGLEPLDFSCTIMVLGKTGVGKSATINSIFDEVKFSTDSFELGTRKVQVVVGTVQGIKVRVIDTPGLHTSCADQHRNEKILRSVRSFTKKNPPDIVLYLDRLDMQSRDFGDVPLLRTITNIFGHSIWFNAIIVLTHAASAPPDGSNGLPLSYEMFVTQRSHVVQQAIRQAAGDARLMNPVSLVENHSACRTNRAGQRVLPNGQVWKPQLLLLSFASKILSEANTLLKLQDNPPGKPSGNRPRVPPLPFLLSSLLQSRPQLRLPEEQFGDIEEDLDDVTDSDEESEYDELPPFKRLTKEQLSKLKKEEKKAYFDEFEYREKLFIKKQLKEEKKRRRMLRKMAQADKDASNEYNETIEEETTGPASVAVPMPDVALPNSFDADNPTHRYRSLDSSNQWLVRPVFESHGWDHDVGYDGLNVERLFVIREKIPVSFSGQVSKDKKDGNLQMEVASSVKHGGKRATSFGFEMQTLGKELVYTIRSESMFLNSKHNIAAAGLSVTSLGDSLTAGLKFEDKLTLGKRLRLVMAAGSMTSRGDVAYGGSLEATLRDKDYPLGRTLSSIGLSLMDWHGDLAIGYNGQIQLPVGRTSNLIARGNLNNRGSGQVSIRFNSSEQLQIAFIALVPVIRNFLKNYFSYDS